MLLIQAALISCLHWLPACIAEILSPMLPAAATLPSGAVAYVAGPSACMLLTMLAMNLAGSL
jgi:hypothetical protein